MFLKPKGALIFILFCVVVSCQTTEFYPKPKGYHRIDLPLKAYQDLSPAYPYSFKMSKEAIILPDTSTISEPYWIELNYPTIKSQISISYKKVTHPDSLAEFVNISSRLTHKHNPRSSSITDYSISTPNGQGGVISELSGDVPSYMQFWLTDSTDNFIRAALYFPSADKADSLAPVIEYMKEDMMEIINTLEWREME